MKPKTLELKVIANLFKVSPFQANTQPAFTCSKSIIETLEQ